MTSPGRRCLSSLTTRRLFPNISSRANESTVTDLVTYTVYREKNYCLCLDWMCILEKPKWWSVELLCFFIRLWKAHYAGCPDAFSPSSPLVLVSERHIQVYSCLLSYTFAIHLLYSVQTKTSLPCKQRTGRLLLVYGVIHHHTALLGDNCRIKWTSTWVNQKYHVNLTYDAFLHCLVAK